MSSSHRSPHGRYSPIRAIWRRTPSLPPLGSCNLVALSRELRHDKGLSIVTFGKPVGLLREIAGELGHQEVVRPLHLLLSLLLNVRPTSLGIAEPTWDDMREGMAKFAPPWTDWVVISPGGQTPRTKRVLERSVELAAAAGIAVDVEHVWSALQELEPDLIESVLARWAAAETRRPVV